MFENRTIRELIRKLASLRTWFSLADGKTGFSSQAAHRRLTDERGSRASRSGGGANPMRIQSTDHTIAEFMLCPRPQAVGEPTTAK
jgi:hypothetical protein